MRFLMILLCSLAGVSYADGLRLVVLESLRVSSFEVRTVAVGALLADEQETGQTQLLIKGTVTRPAQVLEVEDKEYVNLRLLLANVQTDYCKPAYVPAGESVFNAGHNITASLGDYVPARLRLEISYHISSSRNVRSATRKTSLVCPNSMRE